MVSVGVMAKGLPAASARTRSFPAFSNSQKGLGHDWLGLEVDREHSFFPSLHMKRYINGWMWPKHYQTSNEFAVQRVRGKDKLGLGEETAPASLSSKSPLSLEVRDGVKL